MGKHRSARDLVLEPIGHVENDIQPGERVTWEGIDSRIVLREEWVVGLEGLEEFSHIVVIFWLDSPGENETPLKVHPQGKEELPLVGLFATRTPLRSMRTLSYTPPFSQESCTSLVRSSPAPEPSPWAAGDSMCAARSSTGAGPAEPQ